MCMWGCVRTDPGVPNCPYLLWLQASLILQFLNKDASAYLVIDPFTFIVILILLIYQ